MSLKKNIIANVMGKLWGFISVFLFVPFYISLLGVESYGMISFYTMLQSFLLLADAGLSATLNREFAKVNNSDYKQNLLRTFEVVYSIICLLVFILVWFFADFIVKNFIDAKTISFDQTVFFVRQMGGIVSLSIMASLYLGGLMGLQKQVLGNILSVVYSISKAFVLLILFYLPTLEVYFTWQIIIAFIYIFLLRYFLRSEIQTSKVATVKLRYLRNTWKYSLGMMFMAIISAGNTQIDKLMVSKLLSLSQFASYSIATIAGQATLFFALPIALAMFPELTRLVSISDSAKIKHTFHQYSTLITIITSTLTVILVSYTDELLFVWTQDEIIANEISLSTKILAIGSLFLALQYAPFYLSLAYGNTRTNIYLGIFVVILLVPLFYILIPQYGIVGATLPWLFTNFIASLYLGFVLLRKFMPNEFFSWLIYDTLLPILISVLIGCFCYYIFSLLPGLYLVIIYSFVTAIICLMLNGVYYFRRYPEELMLLINKYENIRKYKS